MTFTTSVLQVSGADGCVRSAAVFVISSFLFSLSNGSGVGIAPQGHPEGRVGTIESAYVELDNLTGRRGTFTPGNG